MFLYTENKISFDLKFKYQIIMHGLFWSFCTLVGIRLGTTSLKQFKYTLFLQHFQSVNDINPNLSTFAVSKCLTLLIEIHPINNTKVLKAVDFRVKVQVECFIHISLTNKRLRRSYEALVLRGHDCHTTYLLWPLVYVLSLN